MHVKTEREQEENVKIYSQKKNENFYKKKRSLRKAKNAKQKLQKIIRIVLFFNKLLPKNVSYLIS